MKYKASSTVLSLIFNLKLEEILTPWIVILDTDLEIITVKKRNWYLIGVDIDTIPIRNIRNIFINEHLFGSDLHIKIFGATISALCLSKKDSIKIRSILLNL